MNDIYGHDCLALSGRLYSYSRTQGGGVNALPWAVMRRAFSPDFAALLCLYKMYKLQPQGDNCAPVSFAAPKEVHFSAASFMELPMRERRRAVNKTDEFFAVAI